MIKMLPKIFSIFWKDLLTELRTKEIIVSVVVFALLVLVIFSFAIGTGTAETEKASPGILWVALTFGGVIGLNRIFAVERENSRLEGLVLCPVDPAVIYWGKLAAGFTFMLTVALLVTPIFLALFNLPVFLPWLAVIILLALLGFAAAGTLFSAMAMNTRARDIMLPVLFLPVACPVIIAAVKATGIALGGDPGNDMLTWLQIIAAFDIIYLVVGTLIFGYVVEQ